MGRDGRSARKNRNASRSSRWIMSLCLNITKRSDSAKLLVRRRVIHRELNESFVLFGQESIVVESCDIRQAKARPGTQCQLHKNTSIHGQNHPGVTTWNLHTYLFLSEAPSVPRQVSTTAWRYDTVGCSGSCV